jgi:hypothetical protein
MSEERTPEEQMPEEQLGVALGEIAFEGGFRRVTRGPEPLALARLRELLLEVAGAGSDQLRAGLEGFQSWRSLATLCGTEWTAGARRGSPAARRVLARRLRSLGAAPISVAQATRLPVGSAVHLRGIIRPLLPDDDGSGSEGGLKSHIWSHSAMDTDNVRLAVEEGHDFFLLDEKGGEAACVIVARGHLVNADGLGAGDRVSVVGFTDETTLAPSRSAPLDRRARSLAIRAGDDAPLILRKLA